jgi:hypothetical protein
MTVITDPRGGFKKTPVQFQAIELMKQYNEVLLEGGSRSGKTFIEIYALIARGLQTPSNHLAVRKHFNHAKLALYHQTIPMVFKIAFPTVKYKENKSDWFFEFGKGSQLWIGGTDDKERIEKILGSEWASILLNEISEQSYSTYEMLKTRLNPPKNMRTLFLLDQNPAKKTHWSYIKFHELKNPETKQPLCDADIMRQVFFRMNPTDNINNLNPSYISTLESLSESKKKRFLLGEYGSETEGALWKTEWIEKNRYKNIPNVVPRVIVSVDPNVTAEENVTASTDEAGIIICGQIDVDGEDHYIVMRDSSTSGLSWGKESVMCYHEFSADRIIGEVNNGGDLIEMNIRNYDKNVSYEGVRATRGKVVRAEPIADLYRRGLVHHCGEFPELELELTEWKQGQKSPNRLDALVWGITYLSSKTSVTAGDVSAVEYEEDFRE